jgi:hypothetical protein
MVGMAQTNVKFFFSLDGVPDKTITLREAVRQQLTGQGIVKCECKQNVIIIGAKCKRITSSAIANVIIDLFVRISN